MIAVAVRNKRKKNEKLQEQQKIQEQQQQNLEFQGR